MTLLSLQLGDLEPGRSRLNPRPHTKRAFSFLKTIQCPSLGHPPHKGSPSLFITSSSMQIHVQVQARGSTFKVWYLGGGRNTGEAAALRITPLAWEACRKINLQGRECSDFLLLYGRVILHCIHAPHPVTQLCVDGYLGGFPILGK